MNNVTQVLSEEHQIILRVINAAFKECEDIEQGKAIELSFFQKTIDFIRNYADKFHHAKEEEILFIAMLESADQMHCNPIPVMLHEHAESRELVQGMEEAISENNIEKLIDNTRAYGMLLQQHIYKEDNVLYPMAEQGLTNEQKVVIKQKYQEANSKLEAVLDIEALVFV